MGLQTIDITPSFEVRAGQVLNRRYKVTRELGRGGMGIVYLVEDLSRDNEHVVLKILQSSAMTDDAVVMLRKEFLTLASLSHPYLVRVYDFGQLTSGQNYFYTMELVKGEEFLDATKKLPLQDILKLFYQTLQALSFTHDAGIVHGDIKSENIFVTSGPSGARQVKIMDFGLAGANQENTDSVGGTLLYLAPERLRGAPLTAQTDLYAMGVLMYWALSGQPPFRGSIDDIKKAHLTQAPLPLRKIRPKIPKAISDIVGRLLAKDTLERFARCEDVLDELSAANVTILGTGETIPPMIYRAFSQLRKREISSLIKDVKGHFENSRPGTSNVFVITGVEGSGHIQILDEVKHQLQTDAINLYEGFCHASITSPYKPILEAFQSNDSVREQINQAFARLQSLLTAPATEEAATTSDPELLRYQFYDLVAGALRAAADKQPIVLLIRDLGNADESTLELFYYLGRVLAEKRIVFMAELTVDNLSDEASSFIKSQQDSLTTCQEMNIQPLSRDDIKSLLRLAFKNIEAPEKFYLDLYKQTGGITEIIANTLAALHESGLFACAGSTWILDDGYDLSQIVPENIAELYKNTVSSLSVLQKKIIHTIAVCGAIPKSLLQKLLRKGSARNIESSLQHLLQKKILNTYPVNDVIVYDFQSVGFKDAIYLDLPEAERVRIHRRLISIIESESLDYSVEQKAYHYLQAGYVSTGLLYASQAFRKLKQAQSLRQALNIARLALSRCDGQAERYRRAFLRRCAEIEEILGDMKSALLHYEEVAASYPDGVAKATILRYIASLHQKLGDLNKSEALLSQALEQLPLAAKVERALILRERSWQALLQGNNEKAIELGQQALGSLDQGKPSKALALTLNSLGAAHYFSSDARTAIEFFRRSASIKKQLGDQRGLATTLNNLAVMYNILGDSNRAMRAWQEALKIREAIGDLVGLAETYNNIGILLYEKGDYARSFTFYRKSRELNERIGNLKGLTDVLSNLGELETTREDYSFALEIIELGIGYAERLKAFNNLADMLYHRARIFYALNQKEKFVRDIYHCIELAEDHSPKSRLGIYYVLKQKGLYLNGRIDNTFLQKAQAIYQVEKDPILDLEIQLVGIEGEIYQKHYDGLLQNLQHLLERVESGKYRWYELHVLILLARVMMLQNQYNRKLATILDSAETMAEKMGLYLKVKDVNLFKGRFYHRIGDLSQAYQSYRKAYQHLRAVWVSIKEDAYRVSLLQSPVNMALAKEIRALQKEIKKDQK